jgi:hypothetical protein
VLVDVVLECDVKASTSKNVTHTGSILAENDLDGGSVVGVDVGVVVAIESDSRFGVVGRENVVGLRPHRVNSVEHRLTEKLVEAVNGVLSVTEVAILVGGTTSVGKDFRSGSSAETELDGL